MKLKNMYLKQTFTALMLLCSLFYSINSLAAFPDDLSDVRFVHENVSSWPVTSTLNVSVSGSILNLEYDKKNTWGSRSSSLCTGCNANPWVIVNFDGQWWAGTYEWFRFGQTAKDWTKVLEGGHIKGGPFGFSRSTWQPKNGETYGFMVSGLARFPTNVSPGNVQERTNIQLYKWGSGPVDSIDPVEPTDPEEHVYTGKVAGTISGTLGGIPLSFDIDEDITFIVNNDRTVSITIDDEIVTTTVNNNGRIDTLFDLPIDDDCKPQVNLKGIVNGKQISGTITGNGQCQLLGQTAEATINATFNAISSTEPIFEFKPVPLTPMYQLLLD